MICCSGRRRWAGLTGSLPDERGRVFAGCGAVWRAVWVPGPCGAVQPPTIDAEGPSDGRLFGRPTADGR